MNMGAIEDTLPGVGASDGNHAATSFGASGKSPGSSGSAATRHQSAAAHCAYAAGIALLAAVLLWSPPASAVDDPLLKESRAITQKFAASLQDALGKALAEGGPMEAITVCKDVAPQIASALSRQTGAKVGRTSLRYRNAANAPEPWQRLVLEDFDTRSQGIRPDVPLEHFERGDGGEAHYMKGIRTAPVCLACHGTSLTPEVSAALESEYPYDRARGYEAGDIRGAFSITWPGSGPAD